MSLDGIQSEVARLQNEAKTAMLVAVDGKIAGVIAVADTIKDGSKEAIEELHRLGLKVAMITGDSRRTADAVARPADVLRRARAVLSADTAHGDHFHVRIACPDKQPHCR